MYQLLEGCFIFSGSAQDGYFNCLSDEIDKSLCPSEDDVSDYIRCARPHLFERLHGLPVKSFEVSVSTRSKIPSGYVRPSRTLKTTRQSKPTPLNIDGRASHLGPAYLTTPSHRTLLELQHNRAIQAQILNGHWSVLQRLRDYTLSLTCVCPACIETLTSFKAGEFFLSLVKIASSNSINTLDHAKTSYGLKCVEHLFRESVSFAISPVEGFYDGTAEMPKRKRDFSNESAATPQTPKFPFQYPSNSNQSKHLRSDRYEEIEYSLQKDEIFEHTYNEFARIADRLPDLALRRPPNHTNVLERYKKQGLTKGARLTDNRLRLLDYERSVNAEQDQEGTTTHKPSPTDTVFEEQQIICSCRELDDGDGFNVIKCSAEFCCIGLFHLRCLGLSGIPEDEDNFLCIYCRPNVSSVRQTVSNGRQAAYFSANSSTDNSTLVGDNSVFHLTSRSSENGHDSGEDADSERELDNRPDDWVERDKAIIRSAVDMVTGAPEIQDPVVADFEGKEEITMKDHEALPEIAEAPMPTQPPPRGFQAVNDLIHPQHYNEQQSTVLPLRLSNLPNDQIDGQVDYHSRTSSSSLSFGSGQADHADKPNGTASQPDSQQQISLPTGHNSTPFYSLAPFIYPSLSSKDPYQLTSDEARYLWCWKADCPTTSLGHALPKETRDKISCETDRAVMGLSDWWTEERTRIGLRKHMVNSVVQDLSKVFQKGDLANLL